MSFESWNLDLPPSSYAEFSSLSLSELKTMLLATVPSWLLLRGHLSDLFVSSASTKTATESICQQDRSHSGTQPNLRVTFHHLCHILEVKASVKFHHTLKERDYTGVTAMKQELLALPAGPTARKTWEITRCLRRQLM